MVAVLLVPLPALTHLQPRLVEERPAVRSHPGLLLCEDQQGAVEQQQELHVDCQTVRLGLQGSTSLTLRDCVDCVHQCDSVTPSTSSLQGTNELGGHYNTVSI